MDRMGSFLLFFSVSQQRALDPRGCVAGRRAREPAPAARDLGAKSNPASPKPKSFVTDKQVHSCISVRGEQMDGNAWVHNWDSATMLPRTPNLSYWVSTLKWMEMFGGETRPGSPQKWM